MLIPARIKVGKTRYRVVQPYTMAHVGSRGDVSLHNALIRVATQSNVYPTRRLTAHERSETFWHEVTHAVLDDMGRHTLSLNETFVKGFSKRLNDAIRSAKF